MNNLTIIFLPCCKKKDPSGRKIENLNGLSQADLPKTWNLLIEGRKEIEKRNCLDRNSPLTSAIYLYVGWLYRAIEKDSVIRKILEGYLRLFVISAGYGIVDALEPIHCYEAEMKGEIAKIWEGRLEDIIADLILNIKPSRVFGFFAGSSSKLSYRYFFTEGLRRAKKEGSETQLSGCFYRLSGRGASAILIALGKIFSDFMSCNFDDGFVRDIQQKGRKIGEVVIGFDEM